MSNNLLFLFILQTAEDNTIKTLVQLLLIFAIFLILLRGFTTPMKQLNQTVI